MRQCRASQPVCGACRKAHRFQTHLGLVLRTLLLTGYFSLLLVHCFALTRGMDPGAQLLACLRPARLQPVRLVPRDQHPDRVQLRLVRPVMPLISRGVAGKDAAGVAFVVLAASAFAKLCDTRAVWRAESLHAGHMRSRSGVHGEVEFSKPYGTKIVARQDLQNRTKAVPVHCPARRQPIMGR